MVSSRAAGEPKESLLILDCDRRSDAWLMVDADAGHTFISVLPVQ